MESFLTIALFLLACALLYVFLKSPGEIIKNLFKGIGRVFINAIPFGGLVKDALVEERQKNKERKAIEHLSSSGNTGQLLQVDLSVHDSFIFLSGNFPSSVVKNDIEKALNELEIDLGVNHEFEIHRNESIHFFKIKLQQLSSFLKVLRLLANEYGIDNSYGYLREANSQLFFVKSPEDYGEFFGMTNDGVSFYYSLRTFKPEDNFVAYTNNAQSNSRLSTDFFEHILTSGQ